jgi:bifunctional ADP-heptose synthase (sugar kinase/adenylyltransferase)
VKYHTRIGNYYFYRERSHDELTWLRPGDFVGMDLPRLIVMTNGGFDVLHSGHMKLLFAARHKAGTRGTVIVALDSDARIARKGPGRPIQTFIERATSLSYMPVDYLVEIESDRDIYNLIRSVKPDVRVQGMDYMDKIGKYPWVPKCFIRGNGMRTSTLIERIKEKC